MSKTCSCCGCVLVDGTTSVVSGAGQFGDPYSIDVIDPLFSTQRYAFRRQRSTNQSINNDTLVTVDFTNSVAGSFDRGPFFTTPSTFTISSPGIYIFGATVAFADNAIGTRYVEIIKNDSVVLCAMESNSNAGAIHYVTTSSSAPFNQTDFIKVRVRQTSGAALNIVVNAEQSPVVWGLYIGRFIV